MKLVFKVITVIMLGFWGLTSQVLPTMPVYAEDKLSVITTFYPVYYLADQIAGDVADVSMLLDGGEDAHSYESSVQDVADVQAADLFIYQDDEMEFFVSRLLELVDTNTTKILESTEGMELLSGTAHDHDHGEDHGHDHNHDEDANHNHGEDNHEHEEDHEHAEDGHNHEHEEDHDHDHDHTHEFNPHTWLSPVYYAQQAENVRDALIEADPENEETYRENADVLIQKLEDLHHEFESGLADLENRTIVVQHAAFDYLADTYNLEQVSIAGISTEEEPTAQDIASMQEFLNEQGLSVIYVDPFISTKIAETVATDVGAELLQLRTLETVTNEEMEAGTDYFTIMRDNLNALRQNH